VNGDILKRDGRTGREEANLAHRAGFQIALRCNQSSPGQIDRYVKLSLKDAHRFGMVAVIVRDQKCIDFGDVATMPGKAQLSLPGADSSIKQQTHFWRFNVKAIAVTS